MLVSTSVTRMTITRQFVITEGNPVIPTAYSRPPKEMVVDRGEIKYTWEDGGWKVQGAQSIDLSGDALKKDGTRSKNALTRHPEDDFSWDLGFPGREWVAPLGWEWLDEIVCLLRPNGDLSMTVLDDHEVGA